MNDLVYEYMLVALLASSSLELQEYPAIWASINTMKKPEQAGTTYQWPCYWIKEKPKINGKIVKSMDVDVTTLVTPISNNAKKYTWTTIKKGFVRFYYCGKRDTLLITVGAPKRSIAATSGGGMKQTKRNTGNSQNPKQIWLSSTKQLDRQVW